MRINKVAIVAVLVMLFGCDTGNRVDPVFNDYFIKYYGEDGNQEGVDLCVNNDGSIILLGNSSSLTEASIPFIVKTDSLGNVIWQHQMGQRNEAAVDVELITSGTHQGKLVVVSNVMGSGTLETQIRVTIVDQDGHGIDSLVLPTAVKQIAEGITVSTNNDFLVSGYTQANGAINPEPVNPELDQADVICLRVSQSLQTVKTLRQQGGQQEGATIKTFEVMLDDTVKYAMFGWSDTPQDGTVAFEDKFNVVQVDVHGGTGPYQKINGMTGEKQIASQIIQVPASQEPGFFMIGTSISNSGSNMYITKFSMDLSGPKLDQKLPYGQKMEGVAAASAVLDEGYFLLANAIQDNNNSDIFLVHVRLDGSEVWSTMFGTDDGDDKAGAVAALKNGRVAVLGTIDLETQKKMALIIVSRNGAFSN
jgi:hypothetical protein